MNDDVLKMSVDRGFTWMEDETLALIEIWGAEDVQKELNNAKRNFSVYEQIARKLAAVGFSRTAYQCREKIKRLRKEYHVAHYYVLHNLSQKKPMKYYELVDQVFCRAARFKNTDSHNSEQCSSDQDDDEELHFSFDPDSKDEFEDNDTSNLSKPDCNQSLNMTVHAEDPKSPTCSDDSVETLVVNNKDDDFEDEMSLAYDKDDTLDDSVSPWVPNVVLVENDDDEEENKEFNLNCSSSGFSDVIGESKSALNCKSKTPRDPFHSADEEPSQKKKKCDIKATWFKSMMDNVTDKFIDYQETADKRLLERILLLERERIKKDEAMQKLWIEYEERRRKEEQQHELRMMSLFSQFLNQLFSESNVNSS